MCCPRSAVGPRDPPLQLGCQTIVHGSISGVALFSPRVTVVVVTQTLPESGYVAVAQLNGSHPLRGLPEVQMRHQQPRRAAVHRAKRFALVAVDNPGLSTEKVGHRDVGGVAAVGTD